MLVSLVILFFRPLLFSFLGSATSTYVLACAVREGRNYRPPGLRGRPASIGTDCSGTRNAHNTALLGGAWSCWAVVPEFRHRKKRRGKKRPSSFSSVESTCSRIVVVCCAMGRRKQPRVKSAPRMLHYADGQMARIQEWNECEWLLV